MIIERSNEKATLEFFTDLYSTALSSAQESLDAFDRYMKQYRGTYELDGTTEKAVTVRNITYEIVETQVSSDIPMPKVDTVSVSGNKFRCAERVERLLRALRMKLPYKELNDIDERFTYIYGGSIWYAEWDDTLSDFGERGGIRIKCISPKNFIPQPGISEISDMEYCFLRLTTTKGELMRSYKVGEQSLSLAEEDCDLGGGESDTVITVICFYKDEDGEVGRFVFSGDLTLEDMPKLYRRRVGIGEIVSESVALEKLASAGIPLPPPIAQIVDQRLAINRARTLQLEGDPLTRAEEEGDGVIEALLTRRVDIPYYVPKDFPLIVRRNTTSEDSLIGGSDCEYIRPEQQAINKVESRILMKLLRAGITPIVPEDATITLNNSVFGQVIRMKPGESAAQYGKVDTTPNIAQDIAEAERLYDHAKRVVGISDAYQGIDTSLNESGVAKQLRINQATGRLESKRRMKNAAYAALDKLIFTLYLAYADEPRSLAYKDAYGSLHEDMFDRTDFLRLESDGSYRYDDDYLFSTDPNGAEAYERSALWQRNLENLKAGTLGDPTSAVTLLRYWQCQERAHYPHARENVEYFTEEAKKEKGGPDYGENQFPA